jgi:hypothetical protein
LFTFIQSFWLLFAPLFNNISIIDFYCFYCSYFKCSDCCGHYYWRPRILIKLTKARQTRSLERSELCSSIQPPQKADARVLAIMIFCARDESVEIIESVAECLIERPKRRSFTSLSFYEKARFIKRDDQRQSFTFTHI